MPAAVAVLGGARATLNPCGFALVLAFLTGDLEHSGAGVGSRVRYGLATKAGDQRIRDAGSGG